MVVTSTRFEPEIYIQKAEEDIRKVQIACSLAEPPWDGYCGLVEVTEENTLVEPDDEVASPRQTSIESSSQLSQPGTEHASIPSPPTVASHQTFQSAAEAEQTDSLAHSRKALNRIMQQIKEIAKLPQETRSGQLHALTVEAFQAARKQADSRVAAELLKMASFACPRTEAALKQNIDVTLNSLPEGAAKAGAKGSEDMEQPLVSACSQPGCADPQKMAPGTKVDSAAANEKFVAAKQLIKSKRLKEALDLLEGAFEACPPDRKSARDQIQRHISAVRKAMGHQARNKQTL